MKKLTIKGKLEEKEEEVDLQFALLQIYNRYHQSFRRRNHEGNRAPKCITPYNKVCSLKKSPRSATNNDQKEKERENERERERENLPLA